MKIFLRLLLVILIITTCCFLPIYIGEIFIMNKHSLLIVSSAQWIVGALIISCVILIIFFVIIFIESIINYVKTGKL
jgi:hypothetical protein